MEGHPSVDTGYEKFRILYDSLPGNAIPAGERLRKPAKAENEEGPGGGDSRRNALVHSVDGPV